MQTNNGFDRIRIQGRTIVIPDYDNFQDMREAGRQLRDLARTGFRAIQVLQEVQIHRRRG